MESPNGFAPDQVKNVKILVTAGRAKEDIDGVRHYANGLRPEDHGHRVALALAERGALVTLVCCETALPVPEKVKVLSSLPDGSALRSAENLSECCKDLCAKQDFDLILHLASVAMLKAATQAAQKIKIKTEPGRSIFLDVTANTDLLSVLKPIGKRAIVAGFDNAQNFHLSGLPAAWKKFVDSCARVGRFAMGIPRQPAPASTQDLSSMKIVVTSGPCVERLTASGDILTNFSSGRQGHEIACALADRGAKVVLISGPVTLPDPVQATIETVHVQSTDEMLRECRKALPCSAYVGVAAVADFGVEELLALDVKPGEISKIHLIQNPDILAFMGKHPAQRPQMVIGFAAETENLENYARQKLEQKNADVLFANLVGKSIQNRAQERTHVLKITRKEICDCGETDKYQVGMLIADLIACTVKSQ